MVRRCFSYDTRRRRCSQSKGKIEDCVGLPDVGKFAHR